MVKVPRLGEEAFAVPVVPEVEVLQDSTLVVVSSGGSSTAQLEVLEALARQIIS